MRSESEAPLRRTIASLTRQLEAAKHKKADLIEATERALSEAARGLVLPPIKRSQSPQSTSITASPEICHVVVSDLQLAKVTPDYSTDVCEERMALYADKVERIVRTQRSDHPVRQVRVYLLGDIVEGEQIFPGQAHQIDASLFRQVAVDGPRIITTFLRRMEGLFKDVHVTGVIGNHGALGDRSVRRRYNPETNADRLLYQFVSQITPSLRWHIPHERNQRAWYAVDRPYGPGGFGFFLFHGDQLTANPSQWPRKIWGWYCGGLGETFDYAIFGHWHRPAMLEMNRVVAWCNGSTESTNTYAQEQLNSMGEPSQLVLFSHPKLGVTSEWRVRLR